MLDLLYSKQWTSTRDEILSRIALDVSNGTNNIILIVPELISHDMERRLCAVVGDHASRYAEVVSFSRLVKRVQEYSLSGSPECMDEGGRVIAMAASARQLHSKLKAYASVETKPEFLRGMVDAVDEFKRCCISSGDLKYASQHSEGAFAQKLEELSLLLETYDSFCQRGKKDPCDVMNWLQEKLQDCAFAQDHVFYIDGFPDFTRQHFAILEHLIRFSPKVTVGINCDSMNTSAISMEKTSHTAAQILQFAQSCGISVNSVMLNGKPNDLQKVTDRLFQGPITHILELEDKLFLYQTDSVYNSCVGAANRILDLVHKGVRYRDIGVVCADPAEYNSMLCMVLRQFSIPFYQAGTDEVLSQSVYYTLLSAMKSVLDGYEQADVLRFCKSSLSPVSAEESDLLENYAIQWSISGKRWKDNWTHHPKGMAETFSANDTKLLSEINRIRIAVIAPLESMQQDFRNAKNLREQIEAVYAFLDRIHFSENIQALAEEVDRDGDNRTSQILNQLWEILLCAMEQMYDLLGDTAWDTEAFYNLFILILKQYNVGTIPTVLDSVAFGSVSSMRCQEVKHLILLGAEEGKFPGYTGAKGVLSDQERVQLRHMGIPLTGGNLEGLQAEFTEIYQVYCAAQESITMFAPSDQPSFIFKRLSALVGSAEFFDPSLSQRASNEYSVAAMLAGLDAREGARSLGIERLYDAVCKMRDHELGTVSREAIGKIYGSNLMLSASQIDKQANCRLAYFLHYGLKAKERKEITVDPAEFGTFVHAVLENTCRAVMDEGGFHIVSVDRCGEIARDYAKQYIQERFSELESERISYLLGRNMLELDAIVRELWSELAASEFVPVDFELSFGYDNQMPAIEIDGCDLHASVRGFVDRVDAWRQNGNNYFRVVDYKTGTKDFDYCDVFHGIGLQMLLYMYALEQGGEQVLGADPRPAGVQYFPARMPYINAMDSSCGGKLSKERQDRLRRNGIVLADSDVIRAMESEDSPGRIRCTVKDDGTISGDVMDRYQLSMLKDHVFHKLRELVNEISSGNVTPNPYTRGKDRGACNYCAFKEICHSASVPGRRNFKSVNGKQFWQDIEKEVESRG